MHLFEGENFESTRDPTMAYRSIRTPLGRIFTHIEAQGVQMPITQPQEVRHLASGAVVLHFEEELAALELLRVRPSPNLPSFFSVDHCEALLWRIMPKTRMGAVRVVAHLDAARPIYEYYPEPGDGLDAETFVGHEGRVSMGTESGDRLAERAARGESVPFRIAAWLRERGQSLVTWSDRDLIIPFPSLEPGDLLQVQFVVAYDVHDRHNEATWLAVGQTPAALLEAAGCH